MVARYGVLTARAAKSQQTRRSMIGNGPVGGAEKDDRSAPTSAVVKRVKRVDKKTCMGALSL